MILSLAILLLAGQAESDCVRVARAGGCVRANGRAGAGFAFFEAFPASGAGTSGVCSTTAPTGAKGETLTFTRASNGTCTKTASGGLATTDIANGDLVVLSSNVARVEYDSQGYLGLLVESARTNSALRSEEFDNAAWTKYSFGTGSNPTVTANAATAPDGTATADRVQFTAVDGASQSGLLQAVGITTGTNAISVYVKGVSGSGSIQLAVYSAATCVTCNYVSTSWSRCSVAGAITASGHIRIGNDPAVCGGGALGAQDVYLWGAQFEVGAYATSYIPTTSATVTRAVETASFAGVSWPTSASISIADSFYGPTPASGSSRAAGEFTAIASLLNESGGLWRWYTGGLGQTVALASTTSGVRIYGYHDGSVRGMGFGANTAGPTADADANNKFGATYYVGGVGGGGNPADAIISRICVDPDASRCR